MKKIQIKDKTFETYLTEAQIKKRIKELGVQIGADFEGEDLVLLGVLNGSFVVMADLVRAISLPVTCEFIKISSYSGMESTGKVIEVLGIPPSIAKKNILIVEDIVDTGNSMAQLMTQLAVFRPKRIAIATLLFKKEAFLFNYPLDYVGFEIPNKFVVGFGLDYDGEGRNYPDIYQLSIP
ncbi:MAG: hypoxanthine phosphoribosyltransferase [Bacteroidetes bacterium]|nr:hypoxanthine phosphoribosyltransferase [Bacteroidota bacterium]MDA1268317.1 hypoxanthine phosphoribosyltransferase [Bacteroidota bacterium]